MTSKSKWEDAARELSNLPRFELLETKGERKQAFAEWINQKRKSEKEAEQAKRQSAKGDFTKLLAEWPELKPESNFREIAEAFYETEPWALLDDTEREDAIQD